MVVLLAPWLFGAWEAWWFWPFVAAIAAAAADTGLVITAEEHQVGGFGNLVAGAIAQSDIPRPVKLRMVGVQDKFGETGQPWELMKLFGLTAEHLVGKALELLAKGHA